MQFGKCGDFKNAAFLDFILNIVVLGVSVTSETEGEVAAVNRFNTPPPVIFYVTLPVKNYITDRLKAVYLISFSMIACFCVSS